MKSLPIIGFLPETRAHLRAARSLIFRASSQMQVLRDIRLRNGNLRNIDSTFSNAESCFVGSRRSFARLCIMLLVTGGLTACGAQTPDTLHYTGAIMGTYYSVKVIEDIDDATGEEDARSAPQKRLGNDIQRILVRVDHAMSTYRADSELSRFNASPGADWHPVSQDLYTVVEEALTISRLTDGAFDITVGPLVNLWGFGPPEKPRETDIPSEADLRATMARIGYRKLAARATPPALRKDHPRLYLDLSAIAKGFAVDKVAAYLERYGFANYLVDVGGELRAKGRNAAGIPWQVAIEKPVSGERSIHRVIEVDNHAIATSGDYRNFFERDGKRYSHTLDPKTGKPVTHDLVSVTVLDQRAMRADALATALSVLGPDAGYEFAEREHIPAWLITKTETGFRDRSTPGFRKFLAD
uniref:FAD:protein FMN transferase n=1 Tax=Candidatus Kentrum sp. UNK TaxID=2126344 RepID=A0A451AIU4_9GAMM|nr:MAG: thiamine biosynthesis lipoprotein [Candidatus Kentron sp. UNK]VFK71611.1 MAG: thiamine biosynthesis lipoprotein [Candidatus Kentron sp. UNK]